MLKIQPKRGRSKKHKNPSAFWYVRMVVIPVSPARTMNKETEEKLLPVATAKTDGWKGFRQTKEVVNKHICKVVPSQNASNALPWFHTMLSNTKRKLLGIHHNIKNVSLLKYLDEFRSKTNRRYFGVNLFDRLMVEFIDNTCYGKFIYD